MRLKHLVRSLHDVTCDVTDIWCDGDAWFNSDTDEDPAAVNCTDCLRTATKFGLECLERLAAMKARMS